MARNKGKTLNNEFKYDANTTEYGFMLKKKRNLWWLLLLLLPILLFIPCHKDIKVKCVEAGADAPVAGMEVTLVYDAHFLWKDGSFFITENVRRTQSTDDQGIAVFKDLPCSVFSYVFYCLSRADAVAQSECHSEAKTNFNFHFRRNVDLEMPLNREDLYVMLLDKETGDFLPGGLLVYEYEENGKTVTDSVHAEADGVAVIPQVPSCAEMKMLKGACYGYADTIRMSVPCQQLVVANPEEALRLRPLKERFTFFVKNKETRQPIPDALCQVTLTHPGDSKTQIVRFVRTSVDGKGIAVYDSAFVLSTIAIHASKLHYRDGDLEGGPWTVEKFILQDDDMRTVWLEPDRYMEEFVNVDSITGKPVPGVRNSIRVTHPDGTSEDYTEIGNSNGVFPVQTKEDDRVEIISEKDGYVKKHVVYPRFGDLQEMEKAIRMKPEFATMQFRTVRESDWEVLPDCDLTVTGTISGRLLPINSGTGEFKVTMRKAELLSIVASRSGFVTNSTKVRNASYNELHSAPQERRDIPMRHDVKSCDGGFKEKSKNNHECVYNMGVEVGDSQIVLDFYGVADYLTVYDGVGRKGRECVPRQAILNKRVIPFHFTKGAVTVVIEGGSNWEYVVECP